MSKQKDAAKVRPAIAFRLAWVVDPQNPVTFGEKFTSQEDAQAAAPAVNKARTAKGLKPGNFVVELRLRRRRFVDTDKDWNQPREYYENGALHPLIDTGDT